MKIDVGKKIMKIISPFLSSCVRGRQLRLYRHVARHPTKDPAESFLSRSEGLDHAQGASICFMVASDGVLPEGYGYDGPGVCLGNGRTRAEGVPSQCGRGDTLLRRMPHT